MKNLFPLILLLAGLLAYSCVDKDYDLTKINTDDVTIGSEESVFRIPLATVKIDLTKLKQSETINIQDIIAETDVWLPSPLPGDAEYVNVQKLSNDRVYLDGIIDLLFVQLRRDDKKVDDLAQQLWSKQSYRKEMLGLLNLPFNPTEAQFKEALKELITVQNTQVEDKIAELAATHLGSKLMLDPVEFDVDGFELDQSIIDLLSKNLEKPNNSLHLYGSIKSILPVSVLLKGASFRPTQIAFSQITIEADAAGKIDDAQVSRDDLQKITQGITIHLPVELTKYYPKKGFDTDRKDQLVIELKLVKRGPLSLNL